MSVILIECKLRRERVLFGVAEARQLDLSISFKWCVIFGNRCKAIRLRLHSRQDIFGYILVTVSYYYCIESSIKGFMYFIHIYSYRLSFRLILCLCLACMEICQTLRRLLSLLWQSTSKYWFPNVFFLINLVFMSRMCRNSSNIVTLIATLAIILQSSRTQTYSCRLNLCFICPACFEIHQTSWRWSLLWIWQWNSSRALFSTQEAANEWKLMNSAGFSCWEFLVACFYLFFFLDIRHRIHSVRSVPDWQKATRQKQNKSRTMLLLCVQYQYLGSVMHRTSWNLYEPHTSGSRNQQCFFLIPRALFPTHMPMSKGYLEPLV